MTESIFLRIYAEAPLSHGRGLENKQQPSILSSMPHELLHELKNQLQHTEDEFHEVLQEMLDDESENYQVQETLLAFEQDVHQLGSPTPKQQLGSPPPRVQRANSIGLSEVFKMFWDQCCR